MAKDIEGKKKKEITLFIKLISFLVKVPCRLPSFKVFFFFGGGGGGGGGLYNVSVSCPGAPFLCCNCKCFLVRILCVSLFYNSPRRTD